MPRILSADTVAEFDVCRRERLRFALQENLAAGKSHADDFDFEGYQLTIAYANATVSFLDAKLGPARYYVNAPSVCDIDETPIEDTFYDARLATGTQWANMCPKCWHRFGTGILGTGYGQHYKKRADGVFVKIGG